MWERFTNSISESVSKAFDWAVNGAIIGAIVNSIRMVSKHGIDKLGIDGLIGSAFTGGGAGGIVGLFAGFGVGAISGAAKKPTGEDITASTTPTQTASSLVDELTPNIAKQPAPQSVAREL